MDSQSELFSNLINSLQDGFSMLDSNGVLIEANPALCRMTGYTREELIGKRAPLPFWPPNEASEIQKALHETFSGKFLNHEFTYMRKNGERFFVIVSPSAFKDQHGKIINYIATVKDISELKKTEKALSESEAKYRTLVEWTRMPIFVSRDNVILYANPAAIKMLGARSPQEIIGKSTFDFIHSDFHQILVDQVKNLPEHGIDTPLFEAKFIRVNGSIIIGEMHSTSIVFEGKLSLLSSIADITELKRTLEELKEKQQYLMDSQAVAQVGSWSLDLQSSNLTWTEQSYHNFGVNPETFTPGVESLLELMHPDDRAAMVEWIRLTQANEKSGKLEFRIPLPDGTVRVLEGRGMLLFDKNKKPIRMIGTNQDITDRKRLENDIIAEKKKAEDSKKVMARFLGIAAHELRTPVTTLSLFLELSQRQLDKGEPVNAATLSRLRGSADHLKDLVAELLDISRLERGFVILKPENKDIVPLILNCLESFKIIAPKRRFSFFSSEEKIELTFDSMRINQVLSNLLDNAVKYTPEESPIEVRVDANPNFVRVAVIDYGPGITKEHQQDLFSEFSRGNSNETIRTCGLGLGLSVCRGIINLHGGKMGLFSEDGSGSTFYFELPRNGIK